MISYNCLFCKAVYFDMMISKIFASSASEESEDCVDCVKCAYATPKYKTVSCNLYDKIDKVSDDFQGKVWAGAQKWIMFLN